MLASSTPDFHSPVVNVASTGHLAGEVQFGNYNFENGNYSPFAAYGSAKTANIYMANEIENRYALQGLHGLSLHPGGIWTGLQKFTPDETMSEWRSRPGVDKFMKSPAQGAATSVLAAVGKVFEGKGRLYLEDCTVSEPAVSNEFSGTSGHAKWAFDKEKEAKLWDDSLKMVNLA